ncbi:hypothetical protein HQ529_01190 [Candidatus Woesearchaeota archaeon]|nr:hypothetical protein [Candidatus Woesearchaeota archaeon]
MLDLKLDYPQFNGKRYVVAIRDNPHNIPMIAAEAAFMADVFITSPKELRHQFYDSIQAQLEEKSYIPLIELDKKYGIFTGEKKDDDSLQLRYKKLEDLSDKELLFAILERMKGKTGAKNLYYKSGEQIFDIDDKQRTYQEPHSGSVVLSARERTKDDGRKKGKGLRLVSVQDPFVSNQHPFNDIYSGSEDYFFSREKQGYLKTPQLLSTDVQALLLYADRNPRMIRNLKNLLEKRPEHKIFTPIHTNESQLEVLAKYSLRMDDHIAKGEQPDLTRLRDDILFDWLFNGTSFYEIGKKITKIPTIFDMVIADKIFEGEADLEVLVDKFIFSGDSNVPQSVRVLAAKIHDYLSNVEGFEQDGFCIEKRDSENETIAVNYKKGEEYIRVLFNKNFPPLIIRREDINREVTPFRTHENNNQVHPFFELFMPKEIYDDKLRKRTKYKVEIPLEVGIPRALWDDYKALINNQFPGGTSHLEEFARRRGIKNQSRLLNLTRL